MSAVCWNDKEAKDEDALDSRAGHTHIIVLHQGGDGDCDRLQRRARVGRPLDYLQGHPDCRVCRLYHRVHPLNSGAIAGCSTCIIECRADGESDCGRQGSERPGIPLRCEYWRCRGWGGDIRPLPRSAKEGHGDDGRSKQLDNQV